LAQLEKGKNRVTEIGEGGLYMTLRRKTTLRGKWTFSTWGDEAFILRGPLGKDNGKASGIGIFSGGMTVEIREKTLCSFSTREETKKRPRKFEKMGGGEGSVIP